MQWHRGRGCLSALTFEFPPRVYAAVAASIDGIPVGLSGGGAFDPQERLGFPDLLHLEICGSATDPFPGCEAIRSGSAPGYALVLAATKGRPSL